MGLLLFAAGLEAQAVPLRGDSCSPKTYRIAFNHQQRGTTPIPDHLPERNLLAWQGCSTCKPLLYEFTAIVLAMPYVAASL